MLKEATDTTVRLKTLELGHSSARIDMPQAKNSIVAVIEPNSVADIDETLPTYDASFLFRSRVDDEAPPQIGEHLGDLDDWFQIPLEETFEQSQQDAFFPSLPQQKSTGRAGTPSSRSSETSSVVSSTERLRERETPERMLEPDINIDVPVDDLDLFDKPAPVPTSPVPSDEAPLPEMLDMEIPSRPEDAILQLVVEVAEEPPRPEVAPDESAEPLVAPVFRRKPKEVAVDKDVILQSAVIKARMENTSDIVRPGDHGPMDRASMEAKEFVTTIMHQRFNMPMCCNKMSATISDMWKECMEGMAAGSEEPEEVEELREGRPSAGPGFEEDMGAPEQMIADRSYEVDEPTDLLPPHMDMDLPTTPKSDKKRKQEAEEQRHKKRSKVGSEATSADLAKTVHETLMGLSKEFDSKSSVKFGSFVHSKPRSVVATRFYDLLVLKNKNMINVKQAAPFQDITITPTENFTEDLSQV